MKTALRWFGYVLFFLLCTVVFVYLTFPTDQARRFAEVKLSEMSGADSVTIADLALSGFGGAHLEGISVELPTLKMPTAMPGVDEDGPLRLIMVQSLDVDASLGGFLFGGDIDVTFDAEAQGGTIKRGHYQRDKEGTNVIEIGAIEGVALGSEQLLQATVGKNITGLVSGTVNMTLPTIAGANGKPALDLDNVAGQVELTIKDAKLRAPIFDSPMGRIQLGDADLGTIVLKLVVDRASNIEAFKKTARRAGSDNTILHIADASVDGEDIAIQVAKNSAITLTAGRPLKDAAVNIHLSIQVKDAFFDREVPDPKDPSKKTQPNKNLRFVMQQPPLKNVLENGVFGVGITGILGKPRVRIERSVIREAIGTRRPNLDRPIVDPVDDGGDEGDGEAPFAAPAPAPTPARVIDRPAPMRDAKTRFGTSRPGVPPGRGAMRPGIQARPTTLPPNTPPLHQLQPLPIPSSPTRCPTTRRRTARWTRGGSTRGTKARSIRTVSLPSTSRATRSPRTRPSRSRDAAAGPRRGTRRHGDTRAAKRRRAGREVKSLQYRPRLACPAPRARPGAFLTVLGERDVWPMGLTLAALTAWRRR